jgi:DNA polymerase (family 10)
VKNFEIAKVFREIAIFLEMDDVRFRPRAYERAGLSIEALEKEVKEIYKEEGINGLINIPNVGKSIAEKIEELIVTEKLDYYDELKRIVPVDLDSFSGIEGLGPKTIKALWQKLRIKDIDDLERAAINQQIRDLPGFGEKSEQNILKGIEFARKSSGRHILGFTLPLIREVVERLLSLPYVRKAIAAGSVRRMKETIGDVDFLVISEDPEKVMTFFVTMPEVITVTGKGVTKSSVKLRNNMDADIRVLPEDSFGSALQYFTGSRDHNIVLRRIAQNRGMKLNEYGLFEEDIKIAGRTEEEIYEYLGLTWIPPELRENNGEIEAAKNLKLPKLIEYEDLRGDLQVHTNWSDGANSIKEMAEEAKKLGLQYIVISDHSKTLAMTGGLDEKRLMKQGEEIDKLNEEMDGIEILKGVELNILKDGRLDIKDSVLKKMDFVAAAVHSHFNLEESENTKRILKALENPNVDMLCHPTTRQIKKRDPIEIDLTKIIESSKDYGKILDVDSYPDRLDLRDEYIRKAVSIGTRLGISSDSHNINHLRFLELGIAQARRGWATAHDVINTREVPKFYKTLRN